MGQQGALHKASQSCLWGNPDVKRKFDVMAGN